MSWLEKLPFRRGNTAVAERGEIAAQDSVAEKHNPPLMLLVNDASGRASFKTHVFDSAEAATDFVLYWFPKQAEGGILAFWAMTQEPLSGLDNASESEVEALVMIRDVNRDGVVYLFSFVDMTSALEFLRQEVHYGTELGLMMLYWAVPVRISADQWGRMMLTPSTPPGTEPPAEAESPISDMWAPPEALAEIPADSGPPSDEPPDVFEEAPNARTGVADPMGGIDETFELTSWMDRPQKKRQQAYVDEWLDDARPARKRGKSPEKPEASLEPVFEFDDDLVPSGPDFVVAREPEEVARFEPEPAPLPAEFSSAGETDAAGESAADEWSESEPANDAVEPSAAETEIIEAESNVEPAVEPEEPRDQSADAQEEVAPSVDDAAGESAPAPEPVPQISPAEADGQEALEPEVLRKKMRARTNGNGHKPLPAGGQSNGPASNHLIAEVHLNGNSNGSSPKEEPDMEEKTVEVTLEAPAPEGSAAPEQPGNGHVEDTIEIRIDIHLNSAKNLKVKRWEVKEEPFEGFDSPPGRF